MAGAGGSGRLQALQAAQPPYRDPMEADAYQLAQAAPARVADLAQHALQHAAAHGAAALPDFDASAIARLVAHYAV